MSSNNWLKSFASLTWTSASYARGRPLAKRYTKKKNER